MRRRRRHSGKFITCFQSISLSPSLFVARIWLATKSNKPNRCRYESVLKVQVSERVHTTHPNTMRERITNTANYDRQTVWGCIFRQRIRGTDKAVGRWGGLEEYQPCQHQENDERRVGAWHQALFWRLGAHLECEAALWINSQSGPGA